MEFSKDLNVEEKDELIMGNKSRIIQSNIGKNTIKWIPTINESGVNTISITPDKIINSWYGNISLHEETDSYMGLRAPQIGAVYAVLAHWTVSKEIATVVIPTGVGKTETMLSLLVEGKCRKLLVTVPSDTLREQLSNKFIELGLLQKLNIINSNVEKPIVGIFCESFHEESKFYSFIDNCNVVITTVALLAKQEEEILKRAAKKFTHYFIDEAHHTAAATWERIRTLFKETDAKIVQFTATPFREDGKKILGRVVYNYPLNIAQEQGFFSKIVFKPVKAFSIKEADKLIANEAISVLEERIKEGFQNQIIMARVESQARANEVFEIYSNKAPEMYPVIIHTGLNPSKIKENTEKLKEGKTRIVVCVNMFGEGFDQPNFKIAALHDSRKGLAVTLQFIGRFTRVGNGNLGPATFIANIMDNHFNDSIAQLYNEDANWNIIIPKISFDAVRKELEFKDLINSFSNDQLYKAVSVESLNPAYSAVVYKNEEGYWNPNLTADDFNLQEDDILNVLANKDKDIIVAIVIKKAQAQWTTSKSCYDSKHELYIFFNDVEHKLLFINSSENEGYYKEIAQKLLNNPNPQKIDGEECYKVFSGINRLVLNNVGLKLLIGKSIRYRMSIGSDVGDAISNLEKQKSIKSLIAGSGFKNGSRYSIGVSSKGRIWSVMRGTIDTQITWFKEIGRILSDPQISSDDVLKNTLIPKVIDKLPKEEAFYVDWDYHIYDYDKEDAVLLQYGGKQIPLLYTKLEIIKANREKQEISFRISYEGDSPADTYKAECTLMITTDSSGNPISEYSIVSETHNATIKIGRKDNISVQQYIDRYEPTFYFIDGSQLIGTKYVKAERNFGLYDTKKIISRDWTNIDIRKESMWKGNTLREDSIQYNVIEELKATSKYSIIINDDGAGEIADIIAIMPPSKDDKEEDVINIELYHLKYAKDGKPSQQISNLYEVCGQAQRSTKWKHKCDKKPSLLINHIKRREETFKQTHPDESRIVYGGINELYSLNRYSKTLKYKFKIIIVQPGIDTNNITDEMRSILACTENYLEEVACIPLEVIGS